MNFRHNSEKRRAVVFGLFMALIVAGFLVFILSDSSKTASLLNRNSGVLGVYDANFDLNGFDTSVCSQDPSFNRIVRIGDSLTVPGEYLPGSQSMAYPGRGTEAFLDDGASRTLDSNSLDYAVVMFGTNDCGNANPSDFRNKLTEIGNRIQSQGILPIFSTFPVRDNPPCGKGYEEEYNQVIVDVANQHGWPLSDLRDIPASAYNYSDGTHFSDYSFINTRIQSLINNVVSTCGGTSQNTDNYSSGSSGGTSSSSGNSSSSASCEIAGGNTAWMLNDRGAMQKAYSEAKENGLSWVLAIALSAGDITNNRDIICDNEVKTIIRPCLDECELWNGDTFINALNSLGCEVYATGHNEPQNELDDSPEFSGIAQSNPDEFLKQLAAKVAPLTRSMVNNKNSNVKVLSTVFDVHNEVFPSRTLARYIHDNLGGDWNKLDGIAVNAYNVSGQTITDRVSQFRQDISSYGDIPFYITETGKLDDNLGLLQSEFANLTSGSFPYVESALFFNVFGSNPDPAFVYGKLIEEGTLDDVIGECATGGDKSLSCRLPYIDKYPSLESCETKDVSPEPGPCTDNNGLCAGVSMKKTTVNGEDAWYASPIITTEVTNFSLLNWMTNSNYFDTEESPYAGTSTNPYLAPCAIDRQVPFNIGSFYPDFTKVFAGTLKFVDAEGEFDYSQSLRNSTYSMPQLGNALACMIWRMNNFQPGSEPPMTLEPRFMTPVQPERPPISFSEASSRLKQEVPDSTTRSYGDNEDRCGGLVNRVETSDSTRGPEIIEYENSSRTDFIYTRENICEAIASGKIDVGSTEQAVYLCPPELTPEQFRRYQLNPQDPEILSIMSKPNPNAVMEEPKEPSNPYHQMSWPSTDAIEISGGAEALAELWKEEAELFSLQGAFDIVHRDKAGIKVTMKRTLYDGNRGDGEGFKSPLTTDTPECTINEYTGSSYPVAPNESFNPGSGRIEITGQSEGAAEYIIPWMGQTVQMAKRISLVYTEMKNGNYVERMHDKISQFREQPAGQSDSQYLNNTVATLPSLLTYPTNLFMCGDLDAIAASLNTLELSNQEALTRSEIIEFIKSTDCMASRPNNDAFQDWLCQNNYLEPAYCLETSSCIPFDGENPGQNDDFIPSPIDLEPGSLIYPLESPRQTGGYVAGVHPGIDYGVVEGTPVRAVADGTVYYYNFGDGGQGNGNGLYNGSGLMENAYGSGNYGGFMVIDHGGFHTLYAHLSRDAGLTAGQSVRQGDVIGYSGNTGNSSGPHLHFELRYEDCYLYSSPSCTEDPRPYMVAGTGSSSSGNSNPGTSNSELPAEWQELSSVSLPLKEEDYYDGKFTNARRGSEELNANIGIIDSSDEYKVVGDRIVNIDTSNGYSGTEEGIGYGICWSVSAMGYAQDKANEEFRSKYGFNLFEYTDRSGHSKTYATYAPVNNGYGWSIYQPDEISSHTQEYSFRVNPRVFEEFPDAEVKVEVTPSTANPDAYNGESIGATISFKSSSADSYVPDPEDTECITPDGRPGYYSDDSLRRTLLGDQRDGRRYQNLTPDELESRLLNACPVNIPTCDAGCRDNIKDWVQRLADRNISHMSGSQDRYTKDEIDGFMDRMWVEAQSTDTPFQWLIAIWLSENGLNPVHKNPRTDINSDVFGCGVFCEPPPADFNEELACVLRKLPGCSFLYSFDQDKPGEYLQPYGPIQSNRTFATKVFLVWDQLAEVQGVSGPRDPSVPNCSMYVYDEDSAEMQQLQWAIDLLNSI